VLSDALDAELAAAPGTVSVYAGRPGAAPAYTRLPDVTHYAASTMKVAVLAALHRAADAGRLDLDAPVPVRNAFTSALPGAPEFRCRRDHDNDDAVWERLDRPAPLGWLATRMIVRSSNLATNLVLAHVGLSAVAEVWALAGAAHSVTGRGIEDAAAREAGITNVVTAHDLAALVSAITLGAVDDHGHGHGDSGDGDHRIASPAACRAMLDVLLAQEYREDIVDGLPPGTRVAHKNGWVEGVRHGVGMVFPDDAPAYAVAVCTTTALADDEDGDDEACRLIARVSAEVWQARRGLPA
jgi:beta-lactamase class A